MSDKIVQTLTGRIFKEPTTTEKAISVEIVSNLYQKQKDGKPGSQPLYTKLVLTGNLLSLWGSRASELVKGARVFAAGDWNFSLFKKQSGEPGFSATLFPSIFEVSPPRAQPSAGSTEAAPAEATAGAANGPKEDDLPF